MTLGGGLTCGRCSDHRACGRAGVSESIIMGIPMPTGTGLFKLRQRSPATELPVLQPLPLLAY